MTLENLWTAPPASHLKANHRTSAFSAFSAFSPSAFYAFSPSAFSAYSGRRPSQTPIFCGKEINPHFPRFRLGQSEILRAANCGKSDVRCSSAAKDAAFFAYSWKLPAYSGAFLLTVDNLSLFYLQLELLCLQF